MFLVYVCLVSFLVLLIWAYFVYKSDDAKKINDLSIQKDKEDYFGEIFRSQFFYSHLEEWYKKRNK